MNIDDCNDKVNFYKPQLVGNIYFNISNVYSIKVLDVRCKETPNNHETIKTYIVEIEYLNNSNNLVEQTSLGHFKTYYH